MNLSAENMSKIREVVRSGYPLKARDAQDLQGHNDHLIELLEARGRLMLGVEIERDQLKAENEYLRCVDPSHEDVLRLCKVLGYLGVSTPESGEEAAARWLRLVRTLIRTAETSKLLRQDADKVAAYERLKAENAGYRTGYEAYERENAELRAACDSLREDAKRYRFLRNKHWPVAYLAVVVNPKVSVKLGHDCPSGERLDEQVDGAMKREAGHD